MKLTTANNAEIVIQAKNEADFEKARLVADKMVELSGEALVVCSECEYELWVHLTACWDNYQADDFKTFYKQAKELI